MRSVVQAPVPAPTEVPITRVAPRMKVDTLPVDPLLADHVLRPDLLGRAHHCGVGLIDRLSAPLAGIELITHAWTVTEAAGMAANRAEARTDEGTRTDAWVAYRREVA